MSTADSYANTIHSFKKMCETNHHLCQSTRLNYVPTRLLYVGRLVPVDMPVLCETAVDLDLPYGKGGLYISLSHCWGNKLMITTTKATLSERKKGILWSSLSLTFQEAISITRALGIDYIWIDSLCIVQDDAYDWAMEASRMGSVYENSYLTIGASGAASGEEGLFPYQRPQVHKHDVMVGYSPYEVYVWEALRGSLHRRGIWNNEDTTQLPLAKRAWAFQERMLSKRFVHFTTAEIVWDCSEYKTCGCGNPEGSAISESRTELAKLSRFRSKELHCSSQHNVDVGKLQFPTNRAWARIIRRYAPKDITFERDRLPALSSLAAKFQSRGDTYLAGLWESGLPENLLWYTHGVPTNKARRPTLGKDPSCNAPSWSWASIEAGQAIFPFEHDQEVFLESQVTEARVYPTSPHPRGTVSGGHITLTAHNFSVQYSRLVHEIGVNILFLQDQSGKSFRALDWHLLDRVAETHTLMQCEPSIHFLYLVSSMSNSPGKVRVYGLLLSVLRKPTPAQRAVGSRTQSTLLCERIGYATIWEMESWRWDLTCEKPDEVVTIF
jgi:hypothetical protein